MGSFPPPPQMKTPKPKPAAPLSLCTNILPLFSISVTQSMQKLSLPLSLCLRAFVIFYNSEIKLKKYQIFLGSHATLRPAGDVTSQFQSLSSCCFGQFALQGILFDYWVGIQFYYSFSNVA